MKKRAFSILLIILSLSAGLAYGKNNTLQKLMNEVFESDSRNKGIAVFVYYGDKPSILVYDLIAITNENSMADVFRVFLQFAEKTKSYKFDKVELAFRKKVKFIINGDYFKKLGEEYSHQNLTHTMRTFPENLMNPDGSNAYSKWPDGLIGAEAKQIEDFMNFHKKWYFEVISAELAQAKPPYHVDDSNEITAEAEEEAQTHFRMAQWGMSKEQVIKLEGEPDQQRKSEGLDLIGYIKTISNLDCVALFIFAENKLTRGKYMFMEEHSNNNLYIDDYNQIKNALIDKYGKPKEDDDVWLNDLYKDEPSEWGLAISVGHLVYFASWEPPETDITLVIYGDNYEISIQVEYLSIKFKELEEKVKKKARKGVW